LNGKNFLFKLKSSFPSKLTKEYLVVDLLNNLEELAEDFEQTVRNFHKNIQRFDAHELMIMAQKYGTGATKKLVKSALRKSKLLHA
jgi:hypothetical protein